jgi:Holliday junction resolvase RusA-like endonuclease
LLVPHKKKSISMAARQRHIGVENIDALIVVGPQGPAFYMTVNTPPPVQERPRFTMVTTDGKPRVRTYDPSARAKAAFKAAIRQALSELGIVEFPLFPHTTHVKIEATFAVSNEAKDSDNLMKFLKDAFTGVVYSDDRWVYDERSVKKAAHINSQFMEVRVEEDTFIG